MILYTDLEEDDITTSSADELIDYLLEEMLEEIINDSNKEHTQHE